MIVTFRHPLPPEHQRLMDALGVEVRIDPDAPDSCPCGCKHDRRRKAYTLAPSGRRSLLDLLARK